VEPVAPAVTCNCPTCPTCPLAANYVLFTGQWNYIADTLRVQLINSTVIAGSAQSLLLINHNQDEMFYFGGGTSWYITLALTISSSDIYSGGLLEMKSNSNEGSYAAGVLAGSFSFWDTNNWSTTKGSLTCVAFTTWQSSDDSWPVFQLLNSNIDISGLNYVCTIVQAA
jgi:hypothetical protein